MKPFRTIVTPEKPKFTLSHQDKLISIGSCFSENVGKKFLERKFNININPFGQQYNPYSIARSIQRLIKPSLYTKKDLVYHDELYHSFDHHGNYSRGTVKETLEVINTNLAEAAQQLKDASVLFLTFGTSHIFTLKETGKIVSNCHKLSGNLFERRLMEAAEIVYILELSLKNLLAINPDIKVVLTVSPVRYFAFGHYENSVSKGHLFTAIHQLQKLFPSFYYFPAYELVIDDLRDYRFFSEDMLHPNYQATEYVWQSLANTIFEKKTLLVMKEIDEVIMAAKHRPRNPQSDAHKNFVKKTIEKIEILERRNNIELKEERALLEKFR